MDHIKQLEMMKVNGFDMGLDNEDYEALDAAIKALQSVREAPVAEVSGSMTPGAPWLACKADDPDAVYALHGQRVRLVRVGEGEANG